MLSELEEVGLCWAELELNVNGHIGLEGLVGGVIEHEQREVVLGEEGHVWRRHLPGDEVISLKD